MIVLAETSQPGGFKWQSGLKVVANELFKCSARRFPIWNTLRCVETTNNIYIYIYLGGGFKDFWFVPRKLGKSNLTHIFSTRYTSNDHPPGWIYHEFSHGNPLDIQVLDRASMTHLGHVFNDGPGPTGGVCPSFHAMVWVVATFPRLVGWVI